MPKREVVERQDTAQKFQGLSTSGKIRFLMSVKGLTQDDMALSLGVSRQSFNIWLKRDGWIKRLEQVGNILDVPYKILLK